MKNVRYCYDNNGINNINIRAADCHTSSSNFPHTLFLSYCAGWAGCKVCEAGVVTLVKAGIGKVEKSDKQGWLAGWQGSQGSTENNYRYVDIIGNGMGWKGS